MINKSLVLLKNCKPMLILFEDDNFIMIPPLPPWKFLKFSTLFHRPLPVFFVFLNIPQEFCQIYFLNNWNFQF